MKRLSRRWAWWGLSIYGVVVLLAVFWPSHIDEGVAPALSYLLNALHRAGVPSFVDYSLVEFCANIAMFFPLGYFLAVLFGRRWFLAVPLLIVLSTLVEVSQAAFLAGRTADWTDVLANSLGGLLGALLCFWLARRRRALTGQTETPEGSGP